LVKKKSEETESDSKIWLWSVSPQNWELVQKEKIWASPIGNKIHEQIHPNDIFVFFVIATNQFQGIYRLKDEWYDAKFDWKDAREYKSEIKLELIKEGSYELSKENIDKLDFFENKDDRRKINLKLKGGNGYPSNNNHPISEKDYSEILNSMKDVEKKTETVKINNVVDVRDKIVDELEKDMIGPRYGPDELLPKSVTPMNTYFAGILFPEEPAEIDGGGDEPKIVNDPDIIDDESGGNNPREDGELEQAIFVKDLTKPRSFGLTCLVSSNAKTVKISIGWGVYEQFTIDKSRRYKREHRKFEKTIPLKEGEDTIEIDKDKKFLLKCKIRKSNEQFLISVFGINNSLFNERSRIHIYEYCIFQPKIRLTAEDEKENIFVDYSDEFEHIDENDVNEMLFGLLFRKKRNFGIGHTCSVIWDDEANSDSVSWLESTFMPKYEFPVIEPRSLDLECLSMERLGTIQFKEFSSELNPLVEKYENWITTVLKPQIGQLEDKLQSPANEQIERCEYALKRIRRGIELISSDETAGNAFKFANLAMYYQRLYGDWAKENRKNGHVNGYSPKPERSPSWRPFQLAYFLLNIQSMVEPDSKDRKTADLLWFPTGGGKTEAYLGLIAFTISHRRLRNKDPKFETQKYGVTVLMRYTLRLLTIQQFQRASTLMCACEYIRRQKILGKEITNSLGDEPFSVGLWVGQNTTPNALDQPSSGGRFGTGAKQAIEYAKENKGKPPKKNNPIQLLSCPWCGAELTWRNYNVERQSTGEGGARIEQCRIYCSRSECLFSKYNGGENDGNLPVFVVDEDIYNRCPSLVISTVDKFAQIAWKEDIRTLFGRTDRWCPKHGFVVSQYRQGGCAQHRSYDEPIDIPKFLHPPELIVQDELHLISGPLGTLVGIYESAIELLCTNQDGITPKIIASTATIKKAEEQIRGVFNRDESFIFPPQGFEFGDSFFAQVRDKNEKRGKIYLGVCGTAKKGQTIQAKISASIVRKIRALQEKINQEGINVKEKLELIDKFFTFVSYFNSLKELGNASHMYDDSMRSFMDTIYRNFENYDYEKEIKNFQANSKKDDEGDEDDEQKVKEKRYLHIKKRALVKDELTSRKDSVEIPEIIEQLETSVTENENPIDVLLCTNMLSVGVDIDRLGCMLVNGHPKLHSEYIQATGRIGRGFPGLIIIAYNFLKPRDLSHYENFLHYHAQLHKYVESTSVTPFSSRSRDRAFFGIIVSIIRQLEIKLSKRESANEFDITIKWVEGLIEKIKNTIKQRVELIDDSTTAEDTIKYLDKIVEDWNQLSTGNRMPVKYHKVRHHNAPIEENVRYLMASYYDQGSNWPKFVPNSLREAEQAAKLWYHQHKQEDEEDQNE